jgi:hypothetical protein
MKIQSNAGRLPSANGTSDRLTFDNTHEERVDLVRQFRERNGSTQWQPLTEELWDIDGFRSAIHALELREPVGPEVKLDAEQARTQAFQFIQDNADLLGLPSEVVSGLTAFPAVPADESARRFQGLAYTVDFRGQEWAPRGFEGIDSLTTDTRIWVGIGLDGRVRRFSNVSNMAPDLKMDNTPDLPATDPRVLANILGQDASLFETVGADGYQSLVRELKMNDLTASDVIGIEPTVFIDTDDNITTETYVLAYEVTVQRAGKKATFTVDAATGEVLSRPGANRGFDRIVDVGEL